MNQTTLYFKILLCSVCLFFCIQGKAQSNKVDSLENLLTTTLPDSSKEKILYKLSDIYSDSDLDKSIEYANQLLKLSQSIKGSQYIGKAYRRLGNGYLDKDYGLDTVVAAFNKGLVVASKNNNAKLQAGISNHLGLTYEKFGQKEKALTAYQQAFSILDSMGLKNVAVRSLGNIAAFLKDNNDLETAETYYLKAIDYAKGIDDELMVSQLGNNLGGIYFIQNKIDDALFLFEKAEEANKAAGNLYFTSLSLGNIGKVYTKKKQYELAHDYLIESYEIASKINCKRCISSTLRYLCSNYYQQKKYGKAIEAAQEGLDILGKNGDILQRMRLYKVLSTNYEATRNYSQALNYHKLFHTFSDSLYNTQTAEQLSTIKIQYEVTQKETENELLKAQKEISDKTVRSRTAIAFGALALLLFLGGWSFFIHRTNQQRKKLNEQLEIIVAERTAELQTLNKDLQQANYELRTFNHIASHDIKEPIRNIGNYAGLVFKKLPDDLKVSLGVYFNIIKSSTYQLYTLIEDFALYTSMSRDQTVDIQLVDLNNLTLGIEHALTESIQKSNGMVINHGLPTIESNNTLLYTSLKSFIENGLKYNRSDNPTVELSYDETSTHHRIMVKDNGIGIEEQYFDKIFVMFQRLHNRGEYSGSGVGLSIVKLAMKKLNGEIQVESEVGKGSTFTICLPKEL